MPEHETEYVELVPNYGAMFEMFLHDLPFAATALVRELRQKRTLPETVEERLRLLNTLLYNIALATNTATTAAQIERLRTVLNGALEEVNVALRDEQGH